MLKPRTGSLFLWADMALMSMILVHIFYEVLGVQLAKDQFTLNPLHGSKSSYAGYAKVAQLLTSLHVTSLLFLKQEVSV